MRILQHSILSHRFPFLFGGTFIEAAPAPQSTTSSAADFPSFSEGLSLRLYAAGERAGGGVEFPFLFGGTFIEAPRTKPWRETMRKFPFLFGGTFIEAPLRHRATRPLPLFPFLFGGTFIEASPS